MEPPSLHGPCSHCIMLQVESFPADAPSSPRLLSFRLCASGVGSWFPVGCGRHRIEPSIRKRRLLRKAARVPQYTGGERPLKEGAPGGGGVLRILRAGSTGWP